MSKIDFNAEKNRLDQQEKRNWWKPKHGTYKIKIIDEGEDFISTFNNKNYVKHRLEVLINGERYSWAITKAGKNSLWGQLVQVGYAKDGLKDEEITLVVKGEGRDISYVVLEAVNIKS